MGGHRITVSGGTIYPVSALQTNRWHYGLALATLGRLLQGPRGWLLPLFSLSSHDAVHSFDRFAVGLGGRILRRRPNSSSPTSRR